MAPQIKAGPGLKSKIRKVLLISPPGKLAIMKEGSRERKLAVPPLGLAYMASNLLKHGLDVEVLDTLIEGFDRNTPHDDNSVTYGLENGEIKRRIGESNPDLIGISCMISNRSREALAICKVAKEMAPEAHVVLGGQHFSGMPESLLSSGADYILKGEADNSLVRLIDAVNTCGNQAEIPGIVLKDGSKIFQNTLYDFPDVTSLPDPVWRLFPLEKYWDAGMCDYEINETGRKKFMIVITSRGCPHNCDFCTSPFISGRKYRQRNIEDVVREVRLYKELYAIDRIYFWDDNFFVNKNRTKKLLEELIRNFSDITFEVTSGSEVNSLDDETIGLLAKAGFKKLFLAVESPNEDIQAGMIDKKVNITRVPSLVKKIREAGMIAEGSFMVGFPGETKNQVDRTFELVKTFNFDRISISIVNPLPGTRLYKYCVANGLLYEDFDPCNIRWSVENIKLPDVARGYIAKRRREVWLEYMKDRIDIAKYEMEKV